MKKREEIITDEELNKAWQFANFGNIPKRDVIIDTLTKVAQGWGTGHTAMCIVKELGLVWDKNGRDGLSDKGIEYLLSSVSKEIPDWTSPIDGVIHVPDELDKLVNSFAHHYKIMSISGRIVESEMICRMVYSAQKFFSK